LDEQIEKLKKVEEEQMAREKEETIKANITNIEKERPEIALEFSDTMSMGGLK
jgi:hypothetical protein